MSQPRRRKPSSTDNIELRKKLKNLNRGDFNDLIANLEVPNRFIPPPPAPLGDRVDALWNWVVSETGCGLDKLWDGAVQIEIIEAPLERQESNITDIDDFVKEGDGEKLLHIDLTDIDGDRIKIKYFWSETGSIINGERSLSQLQEARQNEAENLGTSLDNWLNIPDKVINNKPNNIILAIALSEELSKYDWESLHLVNKKIVPIRWFKQSREPVSPKDRPLNVLFMAAEPIDSQSQIDFEKQESKILEGTKNLLNPINLVIEESGWLEGLERTREFFFPTSDKLNNLDILHLAADVGWKDEKDCLLTEGEYGERCQSSAKEIMDCFNETFPQLIFLSSDRGIKSLPSDFIQQKANFVLTVNDRESEKVIPVLYKELGSGKTLERTIFKIYKEIYQQESSLSSLRFYVADTKKLSDALVTEGDKKIPKYVEAATEFRDKAKRIKVATRENFVGRRRQLQNCLKALKIDREFGVLIHGMGGLGKSSIVSRMIDDRLPNYKPIIWSGWTEDNKNNNRDPLNEEKLLNLLSEKLFQEENLQQYLQVPSPNLRNNLANFFSQLSQPLLLIFDDFEWNLEPEENKYKIMPEPARVLKAVVKAIQNSRSEHKIIITCRYDNFDTEILSSFYSQGLEGFSDSDLQKKLRKLENFNSDNLSEEALIERALNLADRNPRLLEFLNNEVLGKEDAKAKLTKLEQSPEMWKEKIIWEELYQFIDEPLQQVLSYCLVYELRVPMLALEAVCDSLPNYKQELQRGLDLGLIETSPEPKEEDRVHRVSRILPHIIPTIRLPEVPQVYSLYRKAHKKLHELWGNQENESEEKWQEIFRLLFADREKVERFIDGFYQMLEVQYNSQADLALKRQLTRNQSELFGENLCSQLSKLRHYLRQHEWRKADEETARLFYWMIIQQDFKDWSDLCTNIPSETIEEIDKLWVEYSNRQYGFSVQNKIWQAVENEELYDVNDRRISFEKPEDKFPFMIKLVGWANKYYDIKFPGTQSEPLVAFYDSLFFTNQPPLGNLPVRLYTGMRSGEPNSEGWSSGWTELGIGVKPNLSTLQSRQVTKTNLELVAYEAPSILMNRVISLISRFSVTA